MIKLEALSNNPTPRLPVLESCVRACLVWQANAIKHHDARQREQPAYLCGNTLILILAFLLKSLYKSLVYGLYQRAILQTSFTAQQVQQRQGSISILYLCAQKKSCGLDLSKALVYVDNR